MTPAPALKLLPGFFTESKIKKLLGEPAVSLVACGKGVVCASAAAALRSMQAPHPTHEVTRLRVLIGLLQ